jgi:hypothetical protein
MIKVSLYDNNNQAGMEVDYQNGAVAFTVTTSGSQFDFVLESHEWDVLKIFIDAQREAERMMATAVSPGQGDPAVPPEEAS